MLNFFNDFLTPAGHNQDLFLDQVIHFCLSRDNYCPVDQQHSITLKSLNPSAGSAVISVVITVASTPTNYTLYLGQPLDIDVDGDGHADIRVTLESLTGSDAKLNFINLVSGSLNPHLLGILGVGG